MTVLGLAVQSASAVGAFLTLLSPHFEKRHLYYTTFLLKILVQGNCIRFLYLFDYGDEHHFEVQLVDVNHEAAKDISYPRVVERHGRNPSQYGWEEDDDWDEDREGEEL